MTVIERNLPLFNSIDKSRQSLSSSSRLSRLNSTTTLKQYPEQTTADKSERLKFRKDISEKVRRQDVKYNPENNDDKMRKLRSNKNSTNYTIDNSIDKSRRSSLITKSSKSNHRNLKVSKLLPTTLLTTPKILPTSSGQIDEYNYEVSIFAINLNFFEF
uniref:Uncharacterized protein n=1 Tax=Elaeophora elaphi TaxID=1147741 RepID=A0A0R3RHV0_9BILA